MPGWTDGFEIRIGEEIYREAAADGYIHIRRNWNQETTVIVREIYTMREIVSPDNRKLEVWHTDRIYWQRFQRKRRSDRCRICRK